MNYIKQQKNHELLEKVIKYFLTFSFIFIIAFIFTVPAQASAEYKGLGSGNNWHANPHEEPDPRNYFSTVYYNPNLLFDERIKLVDSKDTTNVIDVGIFAHEEHRIIESVVAQNGYIYYLARPHTDSDGIYYILKYTGDGSNSYWYNGELITGENQDAPHSPNSINITHHDTFQIIDSFNSWPLYFISSSTSFNSFQPYENSIYYYYPHPDSYRKMTMKRIDLNTDTVNTITTPQTLDLGDRTTFITPFENYIYIVMSATLSAPSNLYIYNTLTSELSGPMPTGVKGGLSRTMGHIVTHEDSIYLTLSNPGSGLTSVLDLENRTEPTLTELSILPPLPSRGSAAYISHIEPRGVYTEGGIITPFTIDPYSPISLTAPIPPIEDPSDLNFDRSDLQTADTHYKNMPIEVIPRLEIDSGKAPNFDIMHPLTSIYETNVIKGWLSKTNLRLEIYNENNQIIAQTTLIDDRWVFSGYFDGLARFHIGNYYQKHQFSRSGDWTPGNYIIRLVEESTITGERNEITSRSIIILDVEGEEPAPGVIPPGDREFTDLINDNLFIGLLLTAFLALSFGFVARIEGMVVGTCLGIFSSYLLGFFPGWFGIVLALVICIMTAVAASRIMAGGR